MGAINLSFVLVRNLLLDRMHLRDIDRGMLHSPLLSWVNGRGICIGAFAESRAQRQAQDSVKTHRRRNSAVS
jgi:hypothetical protein